MHKHVTQMSLPDLSQISPLVPSCSYKVAASEQSDILITMSSGSCLYTRVSVPRDGCLSNQSALEFVGVNYLVNSWLFFCGVFFG